MRNRIAMLAALAAIFTMAFAGTASAKLLEAGAGPVGYDSEGTYEGLMDTLDEACAEIGQHDTPDNPALVFKICEPRPVDEEAGEQPGDNGYQLASETRSIGWVSDGFFKDAFDPCFMPGLVGGVTGLPIPSEGERVEVAEGVFVAVCDS